eukprot:2903180-Alexandrium_andersonii.AAC.1
MRRRRARSWRRSFEARLAPRIFSAGVVGHALCFRQPPRARAATRCRAGERGWARRRGWPVLLLPQARDL